MDKILGLIRFMGANGAGPSSSSNFNVSGSWLTEILAWAADAVVKLAVVVWGWLISIFYVVIRFCLNLIDILQMFAEKLVGIEVYNQEGGLSAVQKLQDTDMIIRFITNKSVLKIFRTILVLGLILLIIFSILALIKQNYQAATTDGSDGAKKTPREVLKYIGRAIFLCLMVPFLLVFGILGSNAVLASVCNAIKGDNDLTIGGLIFTASAYEANKFREYASDGLRVPITIDGASEIVNPSAYSSREDMQVLFYKLASEDVYIAAISDDQWFIDNKSNYSQWLGSLTAKDVEIDASKLMGSVAFNQFAEDFTEFYQNYFVEAGEPRPLSELDMFHPIIKSIYTSNWLENRNLVDLTYDFSSTYITQKEVEFNTISDPGVATPSGKNHTAQIIVNSPNYYGHEQFATIELEYYVMADLIDFAVEQNQTFYYVNAANGMIMWSDIPDPKEPKEKINIEEYNNQYLVARSESDAGPVYEGMAYTASAVNNAGSLDALAKASFGSSYQAVAGSAFVARYYNGVNRLHWSEANSMSESEGATYIICMKTNDGHYIPVTQTTTKFKSAFLASDYGGPIVARGIFQSESLIPKDFCLPTEISEQLVDDEGNELHNIDQLSPFALSDTYVEVNNVGTMMSEFCGTLYDLTASPILAFLESLFDKGSEAYLKWEQIIKNKLTDELNEDDTYSASEAAAYNAEMGYGPDDPNRAIAGVTRKGNILINPNITGYKYVDLIHGGTPEKIVFYDSNGRKISAGAGYKDPEQFEIELNGSSAFDKTGYFLLQRDMFGGIVIPWYFGDGVMPHKIAELILQSSLNRNNYTFLLVKYSYDNIQFTLQDNESRNKTYRMLLDFEVQSIYELTRGATEFVEKSSGEFVVTDRYGVFTGEEIHTERKENLVVSGGEIFYSNGSLFYGVEDARKLYTNLMADYLQGLLTRSIANYAMQAVSKGNINELLERFDVANYDEFIAAQDELHQVEIDAIQNDDALTDEEKQEKLAELRATYPVDDFESAVAVGFMASEFRVGLASLISEYDKAYYTVEEKVAAGGQIDGTIRYYNKNNQLMNETVSYASKNYVEGYKVTQRVAIVGGAGESRNLGYLSVVNNNATTYSANVPTYLGYNAGILDRIRDTAEEMGIVLDASSLSNRNYWLYDVSYRVSFWEYKDNDANTVAVLGVNLDSVDIDFIRGVSGGITVSNDPGYLKIKNNSAYCDILGKYALTPNGVKNYIASEVADVAGGVECKFTSGADTPTPSVAGTDTPPISFMTANILKIKSQTEFDNIYTYFSRGNLVWNMLFDFCVNLPTISWSPFAIRFVFRCKMGTGYTYTENVVYRLQGGQFYLDYNFRHSTGIAMSNIYRMSSINPFILIFSTVLILSIVWKMIWGLIRRIYDIVLLFLMLPAVCAAMPLDEGGRFTNWRKEVVNKVLAAYTILITLNLYFVLAPIIKDVTSDLITPGDLPTTITGMFGAISVGFRQFSSIISSIGARVGGLISSAAGNVGNFIGNIGFSQFILDSEITTAELTILGHVNSIVYIMFFLVLTTMLSNGKELLDTILDIGKLEDKVDEEALGNLKKVTNTAKNVVATPIKMGYKATSALINAGVNMGKTAAAAFTKTKGGGSSMPDAMASMAPGGGGPTAPPPDMAGGPGFGPDMSGGPTADAAPLDMDSAADAAPEVDASGSSVDYGFNEEGEDYQEANAEFGDKLDEEIDEAISNLRDSLNEEVEKIRNQSVDSGAVDKNGQMMNLGQFDQALEEAENGIKRANERLKELDAEMISMNSEGRFTGAARDEWQAEHDQAVQDKNAALSERSQLKSYEYAYAEQRTAEAETRGSYQEEIDKLENYKSVRANNKAASERLASDASAMGLTVEDYTKLNGLYGERERLEKMRAEIESSFDNDEERAGARAAVDTEVEKLNGEIIAIKSKGVKTHGVSGYDEDSQVEALRALGVNKSKEELREMSADEVRGLIDNQYAVTQTAIQQEIEASVAQFGSDDELAEKVKSDKTPASERAAIVAELEKREDLSKQREENIQNYAAVMRTQMARDMSKASTASARTTTAVDPLAGMGTKTPASGGTGGAPSPDMTSVAADVAESPTENSNTEPVRSQRPNTPPTPTRPAPEAAPVGEPAQAGNSDASQTAQPSASASRAKSTAKGKKGGKIKPIAKAVGIGTAVAAGALIAPLPVTIAAVGGVLAVKGGKAAVGKIKETKFGKAISGGVDKTKNFMGKHPKAKEFAKQAAITAGISMVMPAAGVGYAVVKGVSAGKKAIKNKKKGTKAASNAQSTTPPDIKDIPEASQGRAQTTSSRSSATSQRPTTASGSGQAQPYTSGQASGDTKIKPQVDTSKFEATMAQQRAEQKKEAQKQKEEAKAEREKARKETKAALESRKSELMSGQVKENQLDKIVRKVGAAAGGRYKTYERIMSAKTSVQLGAINAKLAVMNGMDDGKAWLKRQKENAIKYAKKGTQFVAKTATKVGGAVKKGATAVVNSAPVKAVTNTGKKVGSTVKRGATAVATGTKVAATKVADTAKAGAKAVSKVAKAGADAVSKAAKAGATAVSNVVKAGTKVVTDTAKKGAKVVSDVQQAVKQTVKTEINNAEARAEVIEDVAREKIAQKYTDKRQIKETRDLKKGIKKHNK